MFTPLRRWRADQQDHAIDFAAQRRIGDGQHRWCIAEDSNATAQFMQRFRQPFGAQQGNGIGRERSGHQHLQILNAGLCKGGGPPRRARLLIPVAGQAKISCCCERRRSPRPRSHGHPPVNHLRPDSPARCSYRLCSSALVTSTVCNGCSSRENSIFVRKLWYASGGCAAGRSGDQVCHTTDFYFTRIWAIVTDIASARH